LNNGI